VGHSLGGAMATFGALELSRLNYNVNLFTYGAPRVGNVFFAELINVIVSGINLRGVFKDDPAPTVPGLFLGFRHAGTEIHIYGCIGEYLVFD
jgi:predicted lipase